MSVLATCHCGSVTMTLAKVPTEVTDCHCSLCRRYGVLWAFLSASEVSVSPDPPPTSTADTGKGID